MNPSWRLLINDQIINSDNIEQADLNESIKSFLTEWNDTSLLTITTRTSGSTGEPKLIQLPKKSMLASANMTNSIFRLGKDDNVFCPISVQFIAGKMMIVRAIAGGMNLHFSESKADPSIFFLEKNYQFGVFTPHQINTIFKNGNREKLNQFDKILLGGGAVNSELEQELKSLRPQFFLGYGMTETMSHVALRPLGLEGNSHYKACPNVRFSTTEEDALIIHAPHLFDVPLQTNDIVNLIDESRFEWLGRKDDMINSGGVKLNPFLIEKKIAHLISDPFYLVGIKDHVYGERPCLYIESRDKKDMDSLLQKISAIVHKYEIPKEIRTVEMFEYTPNGKIKRLDLTLNE